MGSTDVARTVLLSYPADLSEWGRSRVEHDSFRAYLTKAHETAAPGDIWAEFVGVGCCGNSLDVPLRVEAVDGGEEIGSSTTFEFVVREACDIEGGWRVQSAGGPRN